MAIDLTIKIAGEGGEGVISSGDFLMQAATKAGMEVTTFKSFPSEIKGGYALSQLRISDETILSHGDGFNILVAFNGEAYEINKPLLTPGTVMVYDGPEGADFEAGQHPGVHMYPVPMTKISKEVLKLPIAKNMVAMGAVAELFNIPMEQLNACIVDKFGAKGEKVVNGNLEAIKAGAEYVRTNLKKSDPFQFPASKPQKDVIILEGNEAVALGALMGGCQFYSLYPLTPATSVGIYMQENLIKSGGTFYQAEDEIAALANVIGGSFVGKKSMTTTSGPGMDLMSELLGLAIMSEIPLVLCDVQRGGPSTGMPTKHDQSDLFTAVYTSHGDAPRIVMSAADVSDCVYLTVDAFNLAEKYQTPVILLTDASLSLRGEAIPTPDMSKINIINRDIFTANGTTGEKHSRYADTPSGISPMFVPGTETGGNTYAATGLEHAEDSSPRTSIPVRNKMTEKRWRKFDNLEADYYENFRALEKSEGADEAADLGIISWGLTQTMVKEAVARLRKEGFKVTAIYPKLLWPMPAKSFDAYGAKCKKILVPEANYQGQLADLIKMKTNIVPIKQNVYRGEPFIPQEIYDEAKRILTGK